MENAQFLLLRFYYDRNEYLNFENIVKPFIYSNAEYLLATGPLKGQPQDILLQDNFIEVESNAVNYNAKRFRITEIGREAFKIEKAKREAESIREQKEDELRQSVIDTNNSMVKMNNKTLPDNFQQQRRLTITSLIIASAAALISLGTLLKELLSKPELKLPELESKLKDQTKALENISLFLKDKNFQATFKDTTTHLRR